jgi:hypothetical protein
MHAQVPSISDATIEKLSKFVYGTVGYSIGSKEIAGFSEKLTEGQSTLYGWINLDYTYIENILNFLGNKVSGEDISELLKEYFEFLAYIPIVIVSNLSFEWYSPLNDGGFSTTPFFTTCFFDVWYQPLNSFNLAYVKAHEEIDFPLEQLDNSASGVSDFDRLSLHEQEQVDRIGNEIISINQRTSDGSLIQGFKDGPLLFRDDTNRDGSIDGKDKQIDYIIFKRSIAINNNCFDVSYVGSKDAVLKDYFTSIRTKYRAYQYVNYSQSVVRKERDTFFIRIGSSMYDGDNKVRLGNVGEKTYNDLSFLKYFIYDFSFETEENRPISYELEYDLSKIPDGTNGFTEEYQRVKNSVSLVSTRNMMALNYEYNDNVGAGTYFNDLKTPDKLGGIPQTWHIWDKKYNEKHKVYFSNYIDFYSLSTMNPDIDQTKEEIKEYLLKMQKSPIVDDIFSYKTVFWVCEDNTDDDSGRLFYKDVSERINHTVQFIYYAPNDDVLLSDNFISGTPMIGRHDYPFNACYGSDEFKIDSLPHAIPSGDDNLPLNRVTLRRDDNGIPYIKVLFSGFSCIKMCYKNPETDEITDIAVFKNDSSDINRNFYFMINDTKSDYVLADYHGILYRKYKVTTYENSESGVTGDVPVSDLFPRTVEQIYDEED